MITTVMTTDKKEFREMIDKLNVMQKRVFSPDEVDYLTDCDGFEYLEFKQEDESDEELLPNSRGTWTTTFCSTTARTRD